MSETTILKAACLKAAATLIAARVAGNEHAPGWPIQQTAAVAEQLYDEITRESVVRRSPP